MLKHKMERIIFDADDTLWENNIFYVEAEQDIISLISEEGFDRKEISQRFDAAERHVVEKYGYGSKNFILILEDLYHTFLKDIATEAHKKRFGEIVDRFKAHPNRLPRIFSGVKDTMQALRERYELYILTKGDYQEQLNKITLAGMLDLVDDYFIAEEKNDDYYRKILDRHQWIPGRTCMVGNSPKSDINPALRVGMYAIYIPYKHTWKMDHETLDTTSDKLIELKSFEELRGVL